MGVRGRVGGWLLRLGEVVRSSNRLRWLLTSLGVAGPAMSAYAWCVQGLFGDDVEVDVAGVTATVPSVAPAHLTNELPVLEDFVREVRASEGDVWDVGAAVGLYAIPAAKATGGTVRAFEPFPTQYRQLEENVGTNGVEARVELYTVALADDRGLRPFDTGVAALTERDADSSVETWTGDGFADARDLAPPDVIKIDVEGAEAAVLRGLEQTLGAGGCSVVYVEVHPDHLARLGEDPDDVREYLRDAGYEVERLASSSDGRYAIKAFAR